MVFPGFLNVKDRRKKSTKEHKNLFPYRDVEMIQRCIYLDIRCYEMGDFRFLTLLHYIWHDLWELRNYLIWRKRLETK